jgi:hypothetical protein
LRRCEKDESIKKYSSKEENYDIKREYLLSPNQIENLKKNTTLGIENVASSMRSNNSNFLSNPSHLNDHSQLPPMIKKHTSKIS